MISSRFTLFPSFYRIYLARYDLVVLKSCISADTSRFKMFSSFYLLRFARYLQYDGKIVSFLSFWVDLIGFLAFITFGLQNKTN